MANVNTTKTTNKIIFEFRNTDDKAVYISITKCKDYSSDIQQACDNIAETIIANQACLNYSPPLWYLKHISHVGQTVNTTIEDNR